MVGALANWPPTTTDFVTQLIEEHPIEEGSVKIIWAHNDLHPGNFYVRDAPEGSPMDERLLFIDYDNSDFGTRNFDFTYYLLNSDVILICSLFFKNYFSSVTRRCIMTF